MIICENSELLHKCNKRFLDLRDVKKQSDEKSILKYDKSPLPFNSKRRWKALSIKQLWFTYKSSPVKG